MAVAGGSADRPRMRMLREVADRGDAIRAAARFYAREREPLDALLGDLRAARDLLGLPQPTPEMIQTARTAWAAASVDDSVEDVHEDPLTGLTVAPHARERLRSLCARPEVGDLDAGGPYVLVVLTVLDAGMAEPPARPLDEALREPFLVALIAETVRLTFDRCELVTSLGVGQILAVVERDPFTENRIQELEWLLRRRLPVRFTPRIHALDMPGTETELFDVLAGLTVGEYRSDPPAEG